MGNIYQVLSKFDEAQKSYGQALAQSESSGDEKSIAKALSSQGKLLMIQARYPEALDKSFRSLKIAEEIKDEMLIAQSCSNIGGIYFRTGKNKEALDYYKRALSLFEKRGDRKGMGMVLSNVGAINFGEGKLDTALGYLKTALKINEEIGSMDVAGMNIANIAGIYLQQKKYNESLVYSFRSLRLNEQMADINNIGIDQLNIGSTYFNAAIDTGKALVADSLMPAGRADAVRKAIYYMEEAKKSVKAVSGDINALREVHISLASAYEQIGDYRGALANRKEYEILQDSINSTDNRVKLAGLETDRAKLEKKQQEALTKLTQNKRRNETIFFSIGLVLLSLAVIFVTRERRKSDKLLLNILPAEVAKELKEKGSTTAQSYDEVTVLFTDFVNFTSVAESMNPQALVNELHTCFKAFDSIISKYGIEKIKTIGDAYLAVAGLPRPDKDHADKVVKAAIEILQYVKARKRELGANSFDIRIGINSGSVVAGIVGVKKFAYDIWGDTVNTAARMEQNSETGRINISESTYALVKGKVNCTFRGELEVKNKGKMAMYFVEA
jgi:adenylate cyclase